MTTGATDAPANGGTEQHQRPCDARSLHQAVGGSPTAKLLIGEESRNVIQTGVCSSGSLNRRRPGGCGRARMVPDRPSVVVVETFINGHAPNKTKRRNGTAKRFVLVDDKGEALATLGVEGNGSFGLSIRSAESSFTDENLSHLKPAVRDQLRQFGRTHVVDDAVSIVVSKNGDVSETLGRVVQSIRLYRSTSTRVCRGRTLILTVRLEPMLRLLRAVRGKSGRTRLVRVPRCSWRVSQERIRFFSTATRTALELSLIGERGTGRAVLAVSHDGPSLKLSDDAETTRASFGSVSLERIATGTTGKRGIFDRAIRQGWKNDLGGPVSENRRQVLVPFCASRYPEPPLPLKRKPSMKLRRTLRSS